MTPCKYIKCDVSTICMGMAASHGRVFAVRRELKGKRLALPNSDHHDSPAVRRRAGSGDRHARSTPSRILDVKKKLNQMLAEATGQPLEVIERDTERDNFMTAQQALEYGLIDKIIEKR